MILMVCRNKLCNSHLQASHPNGPREDDFLGQQPPDFDGHVPRPVQGGQAPQLAVPHPHTAVDGAVEQLDK